MILAEKVMNIEVVQLIKIYNPTVRDIRLNLIGVWIYPRSIVECLHVTSLLSSESAVLANNPHIENILAIYMLLLVLVLVKS
jgi:hypothetical protein